MRRNFIAGSTNITLPILIKDTSSSTGAGLGSLVFNSAGLTCDYRREGQSTYTAITLVTATLGTYTSGGFVADGSRGGYELGIPTAVLAAGAKWVIVRIYGATNALDCLIELQLEAVNNQDAVRYGMTALPNATAAASGGLPTVGTGTGQISLVSGGVDLQTIKTQAVVCGAGVTVLASVGTAATSTAQTGDSFARLGAGGAGLTAIGDSRMTNLDATVTSRMATYTQPTGFLSATFPTTSTVASTTNITNGTITTVTNLTNAPTNGDFTAAMKSSITTAVPTVAQVATGVWTDTTAGDFTIANSIGKALYNAFAANTSVFTTASLVNAPTGGSAPTAAAIATAVWQDATAGDFTATGSIGKSLAGVFASLGSSVFASAAFANSLDSIVIETGVNARQALSPILAAAAGVVSGAGTGTVVLKGGNVATTRITATVDANGNRSAVTLSLPS